MIHIFVKKDYNKETLRSLLEYINDTVGRELTYGINTDYDKDVVIEIDDPIDEENTIELSGNSVFKDDLCILIEELYCKAFVNGEPIIIRKYVEEML
ncbi:terminal repeat-encoded protein [Staphylococcus phage vB_SauH_SAP1]|uniref:Terminal repeat-encoded protein n=1 Tax=Staphylococcus phage vB_SauH_SAP1 TaxID=2759206 RepID=A0A7G7WVH7_9CAUD|nr:terminal repeat-encoded protein [Staphylococcus phage vB_SauH_SAP1]